MRNVLLSSGENVLSHISSIRIAVKNYLRLLKKRSEELGSIREMNLELVQNLGIIGVYLLIIRLVLIKLAELEEN